MATTREATHAGSWYSADEETLSLQLDRWLEDVPERAPCIGPATQSAGKFADFPTPGARVIIAPHAGYSYSGKAAAWAYSAADWSKAKRIFILGPSHHHYLTRCALSSCQTYTTPFGTLSLDATTIAELHKTGKFDNMDIDVDEAEHSIEMQLPYIHKMLLRTFSVYAPSTSLPPLIPILVGNTTPSTQRHYAALLAPYLSDPSSIFVISSDFAHWGSRFRYTYYEPGLDPSQATNLRSGDKPRDPPLHESIKAVDMRCMEVIERGGVEEWWDVLERTRNTVCGRNPIGICLAAVEEVRRGRGGGGGGHDGGEVGRFRFVRYERSSECVTGRDSSVSYASGFAVL